MNEEVILFTPKNKAELRAALEVYDENKNIAIERYGWWRLWPLHRERK